MGFKSASGRRGREIHMALKRAMDIMVSLVGLIVLGPLVAVIALLIKWETPGPVFFRQRRVGRGGREYDMMKFRTMVAGDHSDVTPRNPDGSLALEGDADRITSVGRLLRRVSLDELPQLVNVLRGDMSLVGPRPDLPCHLADYDDLSRRRLEVRPGMSGLAQVSGRNGLDLAERRRLDIYYVDQYSLMLDLRVLAMTPVVVLTGRGLYQGDEAPVSSAAVSLVGSSGGDRWTA